MAISEYITVRDLDDIDDFIHSGQISTSNLSVDAYRENISFEEVTKAEIDVLTSSESDCPVYIYKLYKVIKPRKIVYEAEICDPHEDQSVVTTTEETTRNRDLMSLLEPRVTYKPLEYPQALLFWKRHEQVHWLVEEADFSKDKHDWDVKLKPGEVNLLSKLFRFFTQSDVDVATGYADKLIPVLGKKPELKMLLMSNASREAIHIDAYAKVLETVGTPDSEFTAFKKIKQMMDKHDYLDKFDPTKVGDEPTPAMKREIAKALAVYSAFTEGLSLFSSFAILLNFSRFNKMLGMCKVVEWSIRDELMHVESMTWLFRTFIKENPEIWTDDFKREIYQICRDIVTLEDNFIDVCFEEAGEIEGLTPEDVKQYIRFIADRRLADLGLKPNYNVTKNPLDWMDWMLADSQTNFFEARVTEYQKGTDNDWDGAFDDED